MHKQPLQEFFMRDYREHRSNKDWWDGKVVFGLTRNDLSMIALGVIIAGIFLSLNWDWIFGLR